MKLFTLKRFETYTYSTHTIFIATSMEEAKRLCEEFYDKFHEPYQQYLADCKERDIWYKENSNYKCEELNKKCWAFEERCKNTYALNAFGFASGYSRQELIDMWISEVIEFESDCLLIWSETDGD